jgi:hypothetical protein
MSIFDKKTTASKEALKAEHPDIYNEVLALGTTTGQKDMETQIETARTEGHEKGETQGMAEGEKIGAKNELARCLAVQAQSQPGHEKLIAGMVKDGSSAGDAAQAVIAAEKSKKSKMLADLGTDAPVPVEPDSPDETPPAGDDPIKAAWEGKDGATFKAEFGGDYDSYKGFFENDERYKKTGKISLPA